MTVEKGTEFKIIANTNILESLGISDNVTGKKCYFIKEFPDGWYLVELLSGCQYDIPKRYLELQKS